MEKCDCEWQDFVKKQYEEDKDPLSSHAVLGEGWRDARKELPEHEDYYLVAIHRCPIDGYKYAVIKYNKGSDIWNNFKAWRKIDPPAFV